MMMLMLKPAMRECKLNSEPFANIAPYYGGAAVTGLVSTAPPGMLGCLEILVWL
jgi:hypothetical protein